MTERIRNVLLICLTSLLIITLFTVSLTYGRYYKEAPPEGVFSDGVTITVSNQLEVKTVDELLAAVANGYSYVKIADSMENPLVMTQTASEIGSDLILDLNGHDLQRNSREPMLRISAGVTLTIIDSSKDKSGSFYNPVGSVLEINGGTLTVTSGKFESGPRTTEYAENSAGVWKTQDGGTIGSDTITGVLYEKSSEGYTSTTKTLPVIEPNVTPTIVSEGGVQYYYANGNMYFEAGAGFSFTDGITLSDTFLYYSLDDTTVQNSDIFSQGSADFYYSYNVKKVAAENVAPQYTYTEEKANGTNVFTVTVYGYYDDIASAKNATSTYNEINPSNYAAIKMQSGMLNVRGGSYTSYFGVGTAYCVYAQGGNMKVDTGEFYAIDDGVCIRCEYGTDSTDNLTVTNGKFTSEIGDTIQVANGKMIVTGGQFIKDATNALGTSTDNNSAINMTGGNLEVSNATFEVKGNYVYAINTEGSADTTLTVSGTTFEVSGNYVYAINSEGSANTTLTVSNATFGLSGDNVYAINSEGSADTTLTVSGTTFSMLGKNSVGINANSGTITVSGTTFSMLGMNSVGINANSGTIMLGKPSDTTSAVRFYIDHVDGCYGVYAEGENTITINLYYAEFYMGQTGYTTETTLSESKINSAGIYTNSSEAEVSVQQALFVMAGNYSAGIYAEKGKIGTAAGAETVKLGVMMGVAMDGYPAGGKKADGAYISITPPDGGFYAGYDITSSGCSNVTAKSCYGIATEGGEINLSDVYVYLNATASHGLYSAGGNVTLKALQANIKDINSATSLTTTAMYVKGSTGATATVSIDVCNIITTGIGLVVDGGNLTFNGSSQKPYEEYNVVITSDNTSAIYLNGGNVTFGTDVAANITSKILSSDATNLNPVSWSLDGVSSSHYDGIEISGGSFSSEASLFEMTFSGLWNDDLVSSSSDQAPFMNEDIKSYAISVSDGTFKVINKFKLETAIGGGVKVSGGNVTIGNADSVLEDITVKTTGVEYMKNASGAPKYYQPVKTETSANWYAPISQTGGYALEVNGGNLEIYNGTFQAALGNGISIKSEGSSELPSVIIYDGVFNGLLADYGTKLTQTTSASKATGPGVYYGIKIIGGCDVYIYGGTFYGGNGGAFITGVYQISSSGVMSYQEANVYVYAGEFKGDYDGFNIYDASNVVFGAYTRDDIASVWSQEEHLNAITVSGTSATLALNPLYKTTVNTFVWVYYGTYIYNTATIWQAAGNLSIYNTNDALKLTQASGYGTYKNNTTAIYYRDSVSKTDLSFSYNGNEFSVKSWNENGLPSKINCGSDVSLPVGYSYSLTITANTAVTITTNWGVYVSNSGQYKYVVYDKDGNSKNEGTVSENNSAQISIALNKGEYVVFTYTPTSATGSTAHGYLDSIEYSYNQS